MFFHYSQNNSGGSFDIDRDAGIAKHVIIEANSANEANDRAESIGLYFAGVALGRDCECCGDRWSRQYDGREGKGFPHIYGGPIEANPYDDSVAIHYLDGKIWTANF